MRSFARRLSVVFVVLVALVAVAPAASQATSVYFADLSGYNENVNVATYNSAGYDILALKATEGASFKSDAFVSRWKTAGDRHMVRMAYHFAKPTRGPPEADARNFVAWVKKAGWKAGDIGVLDFEDPGWGTKGSEWIVRFIQATNREGVRVPVLYSYGPYVAARLTTTSGLNYWHAGYIRDPLSTAPLFAKQKAVAIQFTNGINGDTPHWLPGMGTISGRRYGDVNKRIVSLAAFKSMAYSRTPTLKGGDTGPQVKWVVDRLMYLGYLPYPVLGRPRSVFGGWVNTAVVHFKRDYHLPATPIVDGPTREAIAHAYTSRKAEGYKPVVRPPLRAPIQAHTLTLVEQARAAQVAPVVTKALRPVAHCTYRLPLKLGNGGRDVAVLRIRLVELGLANKSTTGHASRYFGKGTRDAVIRFQRLKGLPRDGVVGPKTLKALGMSVCTPTAAQLRVTVALDGTPTYRGLALAFQDARRNGASGSLNSGDRRPGVAERYGKMSQTALYRCFRTNGTAPGCNGQRNPANPPGRSTHEQRSDGYVYPGPVGRQLQWWQIGNDISNSQTYVNVMRRIGYCIRRPYPDGRETHHLNFCADPTTVLRRHKLVR